ncbi:MAG: type ISP restriction/modification enzyme [Bellilinea sp.]
MSVKLIQDYYAKVEKLIRYGGSRNESVVRKAFGELLDHYARSKNLELVPEVEYITRRGHKVYPDGTLKDSLRQSWGFWESKDEKDNLKDEIGAKFAKGYPNFNILFEDTHTAILYQNGEMVMSCKFTEEILFNELLNLFVSYEPKEVTEFHKAIELFTSDVPELAKTLRNIIEEQFEKNDSFKTGSQLFLELCKKAINPKIEMADVREMVIQHILTEDIFMRVFDETDFHRDNVIAKNLQELANTFYTGSTKRQIDSRISPYYETINARASQISDHHEKQKFLKALYEKFYKSYNPKMADRLGVIYTPEAIVRFMIDTTNHLLYEHFEKTLGDPYVEILDPATGTGTFITELIEYLPLKQMEQKYESEIHCNEVAILPYYIANLNIEFTFKQKTGKYKEFENICFVDTLDNMGFSRSDTHQLDFFGLWGENAERIGRQNTKKISVIIGNPPYNANQLNENENNKNREYPAIDKRIKETYIKNSNAQKTKMYDMYSRFYRWASDRLDKRGIIAFISNRSFLDSKTFDGFRKVVSEEFSDIYIVDLGGDIRKNPKLSGTTHNVFGIQTGVAIGFFVKSPKKGKTLAKISYSRRPEFELAKEKLEYLHTTKFSEIDLETLIPDKKNNWLNKPENNWDKNIPVALGNEKRKSNDNDGRVIFKSHTNGVNTARDEWVFDIDSTVLFNKVNFLMNIYNSQIKELKGLSFTEINDHLNYSIKWSDSLKRNLVSGHYVTFKPEKIIGYLYRPYFKLQYYSENILSDRLTSNHNLIFGSDLKQQNIIIAFSGTSSSKPFSVLASNIIFSFDLLEKTQCLPFYSYRSDGTREENITNDSLIFFQKHYRDKLISKQDIFRYVYGVLHNPQYRTYYQINLRNEFPRIPLYSDFRKWVNWGSELLDLHLDFENVKPYPLGRIDKDPDNVRKTITPRLIINRDTKTIEIDTLTTLTDIPNEVFEYQLGTYTAIGWILERYKEKTPKDPTIAEKFNTYKFSDYKEQVIDLITKVCTVSVETMKIIGQMPSIE